MAVTPTSLDTKLIPKTLEIINKFGKTVTFKERQISSYSANDGQAIETGVILHSSKVSPPEKFQKRFVDGDIVKESDLAVILPASGLTWMPKRDLEVEFDNEVWKIMSVEPIFSGEQIVAYTIQLRN